MSLNRHVVTGYHFLYTIKKLTILIGVTASKLANGMLGGGSTIS
nr:hypothetical protein [Alkalibacterium sp. 20]